MADKEALLCSVAEYGTDAAGENITIKLETEPREQSLSLTIPYHRIGAFMHAVRSAASLAAQCQQQVPFSQIADTDEVGHAFQYDVGHLFRSEVGHHSEMKPATRRVATVGLD